MKYYHFIAEKNKNKPTNKGKQNVNNIQLTVNRINSVLMTPFQILKIWSKGDPRGNVQQKTELFHFQFTKYRVKIYCCVNHEFLREVMFICQLIECNCDVMAKWNHKHQVRTAISSSSIRKYFGIRYFKIIQKTF